MKRIAFTAVALAATIMAGAQNIAVVSPSNTTAIYQTLDDAIDKAEPGSIIYLPGGGVTVKNETQINKQLTIMGVSHRGDTDNADGASVISGNLNFVEGSSYSGVTGVYVSGDINVGTGEDAVINFSLRKCNVNSVQVKNNGSSGMIVNQCYLRSSSNFADCNVRLENNIFKSATNIKGGIINHNIITSHSKYWVSGYWGNQSYTLYNVSNSTITNNFLLNYTNFNGYSYFTDCFISNNCIGTGTWGDNPIALDEETTWENVFKADKGVTIASDYHFKDTWKKGVGAALDGTDIGLYGGSSTYKFQDEALAPIPRIVSKEVAEQTDGTGKLKITVKVKAQ